jgi:hypothetical protein
MQSFLKNVLKLSNALLLLLGLFMSLFSLYLLLRFKKETREKEATAPASWPPPPLSPGTIAPPPPDIPHVIAAEPWCVALFRDSPPYPCVEKKLMCRVKPEKNASHAVSFLGVMGRLHR